MTVYAASLVFLDIYLTNLKMALDTETSFLLIKLS